MLRFLKEESVTKTKFVLLLLPTFKAGVISAARGKQVNKKIASNRSLLLIFYRKCRFCRKGEITTTRHNLCRAWYY